MNKQCRGYKIIRILVTRQTTLIAYIKRHALIVIIIVILIYSKYGTGVYFNKLVLQQLMAKALTT